jgi:hypothetical protein
MFRMTREMVVLHNDKWLLASIHGFQGGFIAEITDQPDQPTKPRLIDPDKNMWLDQPDRGYFELRKKWVVKMRILSSWIHWVVYGSITYYPLSSSANHESYLYPHVFDG